MREFNNQPPNVEAASNDPNRNEGQSARCGFGEEA